MVGYTNQQMHLKHLVLTNHYIHVFLWVLEIAVLKSYENGNIV